MIPDHIIETAMDAYDTESGPPFSSLAGMQAALEAVAADIWDEGFIRGSLASETDASLHETREIDLNPYERNEHA